MSAEPQPRLRVLAQPESASLPAGTDPGLAELFSLHAAASPDAIAVEDGGRTLSYGDLNRRANRLARHLRALGHRPGAVIGLCTERCMEFVLGALAILKAGCAYLPLDAANPPERLGAMLAQAGAKLALTRGEVTLPVPTLNLGALPALPPDGEDLNLPASGTDLACVIFTSGSTGQPKGVEILQRGVVRLVTETNYIRFQADDVVAFASNVAFDGSTFEIWGALLNGGRLTVVPRETLLAPLRLAEFLPEHGVTVLLLTTPLFHTVAREAPAAFGGLRWLLAGGDVLDPTAARLVLRSKSPPRHFINAYGPTEITTLAVAHEIAEVPAGAPRVPIGRAISHAVVYLLDAALQPVPPGTPGELCIGGAGLARGYAGAPEQTAERFFQSPFGRLYRTGDLALLLPDGTLDFLGRQDQQIKLRGYRIELTEIEAALRRIVPAGECRVLARETRPGERTLLAYFTPAASGTALPPGATLREELSRLLPEYMLPAAYLQVPRFPLTPNGKLAMEELPLPASEPAAVEATEGAGAPEPGHSTLHSQLIEIWQEVLERSPVGVQDDFFALGGHSLLAVQMLALVEKRLGARVDLATLFEKATVAHLAERILGQLQAAAAEEPFVAMQREGRGAPFIFFHGDFAGGGFFARGLAEDLGPQRPVYAIHPHGLRGDAPPPSITVMAADRLETIRRLQPHGPYLLGGYCNGALVAFEMARLLEAAGEKVPLVVLLMADGFSWRHRHWQRIAGFFSTVLREAMPQREARFLRWSRWADGQAAYWGRHLSSMRSLRGRPLREKIARTLAKAGRVVSRLLGRTQAVFPAAESPEPHWDVYNDASRSYMPGHFGGRLLMLWPTEEESGIRPDPTYGWKSVCPDVRLVYVPGNHDTSITHEANLHTIGREIYKALEEIAPVPVSPAAPPAA